MISDQLYGKNRYYANSKPTETRRPIGPKAIELLTRKKAL